MFNRCTFFFFQAEDGIRDFHVTGVQTCALPILSPPVLGAAAFLIAEFLKISYLDVLLMATIPTLLYYFALFLMVEIDARKLGMSEVKYEKVESLWSLTKQYWFHFLSLVSIIAFMLVGYPPVLS